MTSRRALLQAMVAGASLAPAIAKRALGAAFPTQRGAEGTGRPTVSEERIFEWTIESRKTYGDPFNDVVVDVIFERDGQSWRVPTFWRGENRWAVRFSAAAPGEYTYRLDSTDKTNPDLNDQQGQVTIAEYQGKNSFLRRGMIRVNRSKRCFEHADGTPFFWLGDTWWTNLSDRLPWEGFKKLARDRKSKGFTVVQICAGLIPPEEQAPTDPGFCNEGGCVWDPQFTRINPRYFDYADRRIQYLVEQGLAPAIVGGWRPVLAQMGVEKMKKHWRYVIARYGAYPVIWIAGGEVYDPPHPPPARVLAELAPGWVREHFVRGMPTAGWTEITRYIRNIDPYHHPLSVHEKPPPFDDALKDESLTDFDLCQLGHFGDPSIATEIALLNKRYACTTVTKPQVVGEIGYEQMGGDNSDTYQRNAFWLAMLNGAAGFTYGTISTAEAYSPDGQLHRVLLSPYTWEESMAFRGARELGMGAHLLRSYPWWKVAPHPEWLTPQGTTLLEPNDRLAGFDIDLVGAVFRKQRLPPDDLPLGEWHRLGGKWRLPYAAGIPRQLRLIYLPYTYSRLLLYPPPGPTSPVPIIQGLEASVRYHAYYWDPILGIKFDLGVLDRDRGKVDISNLDRKLYDASGKYRGELHGPVWGEYGTHQRIIGDRYEPERLPWKGDWLLIMEKLA